MQFKELNVIPQILKALEKENYSVPTPIQKEAIPVILKGKDVLGCAQTGTGKTAAFAIPTLQRLSENKGTKSDKRKIRALIITPTRELALQIYESFCTYGKYTDLKSCVIFGGVSQKPQEEMLQKGIDILVATPGRLNDLISKNLVDLKQIEIFILDEADRMLDMGFIHDVNKIISKLPSKKQTLLFSATMPPEIARMSNTILHQPVKIEITPVSSTVDLIEQYLYYVDKSSKKDLLIHILKDKSIESALVFARTKHGADRIVRQLAKDKIAALAIHGDKSQGARQNALSQFKNKTLRILIATDIAARGIDIDELTHVINYDLPDTPETYVHRIGRTGRAGLGGVAISFCDFDEKEQLKEIEQLIGKKITEIKDHPYPMINLFPAVKNTQPRTNNKALSKDSISHRNSSPKDKIQSAIIKRISQPGKSANTNAEKNKSSSTNTTFSKDKAGSGKINSATYSKSARTNSKLSNEQKAGSDKTKYVMRADGTLKEKKNYFTGLNKRKRYNKDR